MLVLPEKVVKSKYSLPSGGEQNNHSLISEDDFFAFLDSRTGKIDGVVVTGGEPTMHGDLPDFLRRIKSMGFKVKLDTNGTNPSMLSALIGQNLVDYIAMDIKTSPNKYDFVTASQPDMEKIRESVQMLIASEIPHEFRTTVVPGLVELEDIKEMAEFIAGAEKWYLQPFKSNTTLINDRFENAPGHADKTLELMREIAEEFVRQCLIR